MKIYSIGYGTSRTVPTLIEQLKKRGIEILVECRTSPFSKFNPPFSRNALKPALEAAGIQYLHDERLGGKQEFGADYEQAINDLLSQSKEERPPVILMCSELDPRSCHRFKKIGQDLAGQGIQIVHIDKDDTDWQHPIHETSGFFEGFGS